MNQTKIESLKAQIIELKASGCDNKLVEELVLQLQVLRKVEGAKRVLA